MAWNTGANWLDPREAAASAARYLDIYDPEVRQISLLTRDWVSDITHIPPVQLVSATRMQQAVMARQLWSSAMFAAGYSYPQIARAQMRKCHSTIIHLLHHKKILKELVPYQKVALRFGANLGTRRLKYIEEGVNPKVDPLHIQRGVKNRPQRELRIQRMQELESNLAHYKGYDSRIVNDNPMYLRGLIPPPDETMEDLAVLMAREAAGG